METFADVIHELIDVVLTGDTAAKAHAVIDGASGPRSEAAQAAKDAESAAPAGDEADDAATGDEADDVPATGGTDIPGS